MTIYIYRNLDGRQEDSHAGPDNTECETWAERYYGTEDYHYSYSNWVYSNAVNN
jgi:hypothetical protein